MDKRALIFSNLINGVPVEQVARDFDVGENEVMNIFTSVLRMVKSFCFQRGRGYRRPGEVIPGTPVPRIRAYPIIVASTIAEAQAYRLTCLEVLSHLKLDDAPKYKDIQGEIIKPNNFDSIARNLR